jgi:hypothetical protein
MPRRFSAGAWIPGAMSAIASAMFAVKKKVDEGENVAAKLMETSESCRRAFSAQRLSLVCSVTTYMTCLLSASALTTASQLESGCLCFGLTKCQGLSHISSELLHLKGSNGSTWCHCECNRGRTAPAAQPSFQHRDSESDDTFSGYVTWRVFI